jgi:4,5:9,10-diseco-3-hydroxy-5,9,17-trioxoandrosta-1(10),2-diene-4-oate hydrolase
VGAGDGAIFTRHTTQVGDQAIPYLKGGTQRDLEPVLVLHGLGGAGKWDSFHMALGTVTSAYLPVLPGWAEGQTALAPKDSAELMLQFLDALEIPQVTMVGHSFGGWVAMHVASAHPDRVARLVLVAPLGLGPNDLSDLDEEEFAKRAFGKLGLVATANPYGFGAEFENVRKGPEFERQWKGRGTVAHMKPDPSLIDAMRSVTAPTLLVWGREDGIVRPSQGEMLRDAMPNASLVLIERAGHLPMVERNETMNRLVRDFLLGVEEEIPGAVRVQ